MAGNAGAMLELLGQSSQAQAQSHSAAAAQLPQAVAAEEADNGAGRGRKRAASNRPLDERLAAVQEKNRKAQKRFRERQKEKMSTMEAEIAEKDRQLTALREENSALAGRNAVLEKVLALREEQLKSFQPGGAGEANQGAALAALAYANPLSTGTQTSGPLLQLPPASSQAPLSLPAAMGLLGAGLGGGGGASQPDATQTGKWVEYMRELAELTGDGKPALTPEQQRRLPQLVSAAAQLSARNSQNPSGSAGRGDSAPGSGGAVDPARWQSVTANLGATTEQRQQVRQLRKEHQATLAAQQTARQRLTSDAQAAAARNDTKQAETVMTELRSSMQREADANIDFLYTFFTKVLTPKQFGKAAVQSYPFFVDGHALIELLASEAPLTPSIGIGSLAQLVLPSVPAASNSLFAGLSGSGALSSGLASLTAVPSIGAFANSGGSGPAASSAANN